MAAGNIQENLKWTVIRKGFVRRFPNCCFQTFFNLEEAEVGETLESQITAALTFKVPKKIGWSMQRGDQSWTGKDLATLVDCLAQENKGSPVTLSLSVIFELAGASGAQRLSNDPPQI